MSNTATAERGTADAIAPVLMERLGGGRGIVRVGDIVTFLDAETQSPSGHEMTVTEAGVTLALDSDKRIMVKAKMQTGEIIAVLPCNLLLTSHSELQARAQLESVKEMVARVKYCAENEEGTEGDIDDARQTIQEDPLSVEVRGCWYSMGSPENPMLPAEFRILLATGGPAVQIRGELDEHGEPEKPRLQHQDWGTPWTDYRLTSEDEDVLTQYCRCFHFGE